MKCHIIGLMVVGLLSTSCLTVTIRPDGGEKLTSEPTIDRTEHFFFWGLKGVKHIDVKEVCHNREVLQMQTRESFLNGFLGAITLGIYAPRSARIWCKDSAEQAVHHDT